MEQDKDSWFDNKNKEMNVRLALYAYLGIILDSKWRIFVSFCNFLDDSHGFLAKVL